MTARWSRRQPGPTRCGASAEFRHDGAMLPGRPKRRHQEDRKRPSSPARLSVGGYGWGGAAYAGTMVNQARDRGPRMIPIRPTARAPGGRSEPGSSTAVCFAACGHSPGGLVVVPPTLRTWEALRSGAEEIRRSTSVGCRDPDGRDDDPPLPPELNAISTAGYGPGSAAFFNRRAASRTAAVSLASLRTRAGCRLAPRAPRRWPTCAA